jgi:hypothetical protein
MKSGFMYMMPLDSPYYALVPTRRWYAPWLWDVQGLTIEAYFRDTQQLLLSKVRRDEAYGLMKILGAINLEN